jgi:hexokinase
MYMALYVDDGLLFSKDSEQVKKLMNIMKTVFKVRESQGSCFLGIQIERNRRKKEIFLHQEMYSLKVLEKFSMQDAHSVSTPIDPHIILRKKMTSEEDYETNESCPYRGDWLSNVLISLNKTRFSIRSISPCTIHGETSYSALDSSETCVQVSERNTFIWNSIFW